MTSHSYFVVMQDGKRGLEAIVHPENTRRKTVELIKSGEYRDVVFIHHVDGLYIEDVTSELMAEAINEIFDDLPGVDRQAASFDHARDLLKHSEAAE